ncbi:MAG: iron-containing redox enzyme family protein [Mycobacteriales bacterium]
MPISTTEGRPDAVEHDLEGLVEEISALLGRPAAEVDRTVSAAERARLVDRAVALNAAAGTDGSAFHLQQLLLSRIYRLSTEIPGSPSAEGAIIVHEVTRTVEEAVLAAQDEQLDPAVLDTAPVEPKEYVSWLKSLARRHRVFKHPYYRHFIRDQASREDLRRYMIQESAIDGRFDDLLAMMQVGTSGPAKMEIAANFWDEMGNGNPEEVHTDLFGQVLGVLEVSADEVLREMTANALLSGNLAVLVCRYRQLYPEAVGFLGMTEWLVPDRFVNVVHAWERLGLPEVGIRYHRLHVTIDSQHAAGWFHRVVLPAATSERMRRGIARGTLWRLDSSARYLDERLAGGSAGATTPLPDPA